MMPKVLYKIICKSGLQVPELNVNTASLLSDCDRASPSENGPQEWRWYLL